MSVKQKDVAVAASYFYDTETQFLIITSLS